MDSPVHPMGLWDGTGHRDLGVCIWVGHVRIPWTVPSIPWDCGNVVRDLGLQMADLDMARSGSSNNSSPHSSCGNGQVGFVFKYAV